MNKSTTWLTGLYVACELIANTTASKPVALPGGRYACRAWSQQTRYLMKNA